MEPTRLLQPATPHWMQPTPPPSAEPSTDSSKLPSFLTLGLALWVVQPGDEPSDTPPPQVYIGSGRYGEAEIVYEFRLLGFGGASRERTDSTLDFPDSAEMVMAGRLRWEGWVRAFQTGDETLLPALLPDQRHSLLVIARFLRALCRQDADGIDIAEWPLFWSVFMDGFPPCQHVMRGEAHLERVSKWLKNRYPDVLGQ
ncbi:hypothetical protein GSI_08554 [Ganoderma sinense ZZ0214-1]|uniref:Uncharacterized protein n=1 Tax=Ganoderma sinense ZZ0214-1 TaxID=1077348 RepID=A0A2G8S415_9APHY|nr:hypothetical protein GSI_08554 [Ganoderma sinense ZZ0214-1]